MPAEPPPWSRSGWKAVLVFSGQNRWQCLYSREAGRAGLLHNQTAPWLSFLIFKGKKLGKMIPRSPSSSDTAFPCPAAGAPPGTEGAVEA